MRRSPNSTPGDGWRPTDTLSAGSWVILIVAVVSSLLVLALPIPERSGLDVWIFAPSHADTYNPLAQDWNLAVAEGGDGQEVNIYVLEYLALQRRVLNGFWADTPLADLVEVESNSFYKYVTGPLEAVGFVDLTDRLHAEGIYDIINPPSFTPWTNRGQIFGLPHDVHPVMLAYRADILEDELGIDMASIQTWDEFARVMRETAVADLDNDGRNDRYAINFWFNNASLLEVMMLQAGGGAFDQQDNIIVASEANAKVLATALSWCFGEGRIAISAPEFDAGGNQLKLDGRVLCALMPDWLAGVWRKDLGPLSGKVKLMPLPAWEPGGRRTSVLGGTMLGLPKATLEDGDFEDAWAFAKHLYLSKQVAQELYRDNMIISPVTQYWDEPFYAQPEPYFMDQQVGRLYIEQAPSVPPRSSHPFRVIATGFIGRAANDLRAYADQNNDYRVESLLPEARRLLQEAERLTLQEMSRNVFLRPGAENLSPPTEKGQTP